MKFGHFFPLGVSKSLGFFFLFYCTFKGFLCQSTAEKCLDFHLVYEPWRFPALSPMHRVDLPAKAMAPSQQHITRNWGPSGKING